MKNYLMLVLFLFILTSSTNINAQFNDYYTFPTVNSSFSAFPFTSTNIIIAPTFAPPFQQQQTQIQTSSPLPSSFNTSRTTGSSLGAFETTLTSSAFRGGFGNTNWSVPVNTGWTSYSGLTAGNSNSTGWTIPGSIGGSTWNNYNRGNTVNFGTGVSGNGGWTTYSSTSWNNSPTVIQNEGFIISLQPVQSNCISPVPIATTATSSINREINPADPLTEQVHQLVNEYRISQGLSPLSYNEIIAEQAQIHSDTMASLAVLSHEGFSERVAKIGVTIPWNRCAENVAYNMGHADPAKNAVEGWLDSSGHKKNIEGDYNLTGIGISQQAGYYYFTQIFIHTM